MNTTRTLLALAAIAALGTTLISTSADARGFGGGFHGGGARMGGASRMAAPRANFGGMRTGGFRPHSAFGGNRAMNRSWPPKGTNWPKNTGCGFGGQCDGKGTGSAGKPGGSGPWNPGKQTGNTGWPGNKGTNGHCTGYGRCGSQAGNWPRPWPGHRPWPRPGYGSYGSYGSYGGSTYGGSTYVAPTYVAPTYAAPAPAYTAPVYSAPAPAYVAPAAYTPPAPAYSAPAPAPACTCLRKSYQQDGSVLFQDVCTNEAAAAMPQQQQAQAPGYPQQQ